VIAVVRRLLFFVSLLTLCVGAGLAVAASAGVQDSQGDLVRQNAVGTDFATRAYLAGSGHTNSAGNVIASVGIQETLPPASPGGMIQAGEQQESSGWTNDCGTGEQGRFVEYFLHGSPGTPHCPLSCRTGYNFGNGHLFAVAYDATNGWTAFQDSVAVCNPNSGSLGFTGGYSVAKAETHVDPTNTGPALAMTWGPTCCTAWEYRAGSGGYNVIGSSYVAENDSLGGDPNWLFSSDHSPLNINWQGF
jgi:hypothetical protein